MSPDCDARQERSRLVRGTAAVLRCGLAAAAARIGGAVEGANDEWKTPRFAAPTALAGCAVMTWSDAPCGELACIWPDRADCAPAQAQRHALRAGPAAGKTPLRAGAPRRGRGTGPANCGPRCATLRAGLDRMQIGMVPE